VLIKCFTARSFMCVRGMGAVSFDREQLKSIGAFSVHEFAVRLTFALASMWLRC